MSEMVERVTHAVFDSINSELVDYCALEVACQAAKAAIEAMREPTEAMLAAGMQHAEVDLRSEYCAMIEEALK